MQELTQEPQRQASPTAYKRWKRKSGALKTLQKKQIHQSNKMLNFKIPGNQKRPNLRITGIKEEEDIQIKGTENIFNKFIEEKNSQPKEGDAYQRYKKHAELEID